MLYSSDHIDALRDEELCSVLAEAPGIRGPLLEIGGGSGYQASILSRSVSDVVSVDVSRAARVGEHYPVCIYDGRSLPFPDGHFNTLFSSHALEHVRDCEVFQRELHRVLAPGGTAVHVLPSSAWRLWTLLAHYPAMGIFVCRRIGQYAGRARAVGKAAALVPRAPVNWISLARTLIWPRCHGETGNAVSELYFFSQMRWRALFRRSGWRVDRVASLGLFYTGYGIGAGWLGMSFRRKMSSFLGSASILYILRRAADSA